MTSFFKQKIINKSSKRIGNVEINKQHTPIIIQKNFYLPIFQTVCIDYHQPILHLFLHRILSEILFIMRSQQSVFFSINVTDLNILFINQVQMKTKYIRFSKLPKIQDTSPLTDRPHGQSKINFDTIGVSSSGIKKTELQKHNQLMEVFDGLMKKSTKQVHDFQLQARDRSVVIDLPQVDYESQLDDETLKQWITDVCSNVFSSAFHSFSTDKMNYQQSKIFCSQGILRNIVLLTRKHRLCQRQMRVIDDHISENIVPYMQKKYPLTQSSDVSKVINQSVKPIDNREALQNDLLQKSDVVFTYRQNKNYNDLIMKFINWLMTSIDQKGINAQKTVYEEFYDFASNLFQNVYNQTWVNANSNDETKNLGQTKKEAFILNQSKKNNIGNEKYAAVVKEYTHYAIGRKISKNVPVYSEEEIGSGHLMIKSPAILRILTKWCDQLWEKFTKKNYFLDRQQNVRVQQKDGNTNTMFMWMKMPLNDLIEEQKRNIQIFMKGVEENNHDQQSKLLIRELERDGFTHIQKIEKACGKFAFKTVNNLHCYIVLYLNRIIHGLLTVSKELYETQLSSKARWTSPPDLLSFKIGDIMRCKCSSKERQILKIFNEMQSISLHKPKIMKIIRIKNRLKQGTNDILINVIFQDRYLCEIQLAVKATTSKFIQCSNFFSHYVYQLGRSLFGPLTQLCSIWMSLDPRATEYLKIIKNEKPVTVAQPVGCKKNGQDHVYSELDRPFVCSDCNIAYSHTNYLWIHQKCVQDGCSYMICGRCRIENESQDILKEKLLKNEKQELREACRQIVNRKRQAERMIPTYGVCIQIQSKKLKIQRFKKLEVKKIMTIYGIKVNKKGQESVTLIQELIKKNAETKFLHKYLVFEIPDDLGKNLIDINLDKAKKDYIIPQKVKQVYKKEKQILSLIGQNLDENSCTIMMGLNEGMKQIKNMELADNKFTNINFITSNFPNLDRLQLSRNLLQSIDTISKLADMTKLNIRNNRLKELPDQLCLLTKLQGLNIRHNQITQLPKNFGNLIKMKKLESDNNLLTNLPESFKLLTKLTFLDLSENKLSKFPDSIKVMNDMKELALSKMELGGIPEWIDTFKEMISLDLSKTKSQNLPPGIFKLKNLTVLKFQTSVNQLPRQIGSLVKLQSLNINMLNVSTLPNEICNLNNLKLLQIQGCKINDLPEWLPQLKKLTTLLLINNGLNHISQKIASMGRLRYITINEQFISQLPAQMKQLKQLRTISLSKNKFTQLPPVLRRFPKMYSLMIKNNEIELIDEDFFISLPDLEVIALDNNKLSTFPKSLENLKKIKKLTYKNNNFKDVPEWVEALGTAVASVLKMDESKLKKAEQSKIN